MTEIEKRLTGALQWLVDDRTELSIQNAREVLRLSERRRLLSTAELGQVSGGTSRVDICPSPMPGD